MENLNEIQMRKRNMKLFPLYKAISWDYLFFYTISFLFLTQIKNIDPADILIIDSFYYLFGILAQIPSTFIVEYIGRKNSIVFANILNAIYMLLIIFSNNLFNLITAEIISACAFGMKEVADPSLLNESIPKSKNKSTIFAKINEKGASRYYILNAISTIIAGILYQLNGYIPIVVSFIIIIFATIISCNFIEPIKKHKIKIKHVETFKDIKQGMKFILTSERLKGLLLYAGVMSSLYCIMQTYEINLLEDLNVSAIWIGIIFALVAITSGISSRNQEMMHKKYKNETLKVISIGTIISIIISGIISIFVKNVYLAIILIAMLYMIQYVCSGLYYTLIEKYLRNFANEKIDTKIFSANKLLKSIFCAIGGTAASFLLDRISTGYCMIIVGLIFAIILFIVFKYMKTRVGLKPEKYNKAERKYDEIRA